MGKYYISGVILLTGITFAIFILRGNNSTSIKNEADSSFLTPLPTQEGQVKLKDVTITPMQEEVTELIIEDLTVGTGAEAVSGKKITVNYRGTLTNGTQFDSSYDRGVPFSFVLGAGSVIEGWEKGFAGMKIGGKRKLTIPPSLGYGPRAMGTIPANSVLIFEVELLDVE